VTMDLKKIADIYQLSPLQEYELGRHLKTSPAEVRLAWSNMTKWWMHTMELTPKLSPQVHSFNQT
jgi:hypothetical protein